LSIEETIMYQLEASKKNPKSSQSLQREGDEQVLRAIPSSTTTASVQHVWDVSLLGLTSFFPLHVRSGAHNYTRIRRHIALR